MNVYVIVQLKFTDEHRYRRYQKQFANVFGQFSGRLLCADENPVTLDGQWEGDKIVLMSFPNEQEAKRFLESANYQEIAEDRKAGADTVSLLARGFQGT